MEVEREVEGMEGKGTDAKWRKDTLWGRVVRGGREWRGRWIMTEGRGIERRRRGGEGLAKPSTSQRS